MKKVLLTKSQQICVANTPDIKMMKPQIVVQTNVITNTYMQRKSYQSIYEDIFKLLMRLPDKALQQRVIDAINGRSSSDKSQVISDPARCKNCAKKIEEEKPQKVNASTQTECIETKETQSKLPSTINDNNNQIKVIVKPVVTPLKKECPPATPPTVVASTVNITANEEPAVSPPVKVPAKRGRKRNTCVPKVVKRSAAQMALQEREDKQLTPLQPIKKKKLETPESSPSPVETASSPNTSSLQRRDSIVSNFSACIGDINLNDFCDQIDDYINDDIQRTILTTMSNEFLISDVMNEEGLLPIHDAILKGNIQGVQRQVFVWSKMRENVDFNGLISADGEDCLQLAITTDSDPEIVKIIINAGILPMHIYEDSNTALHLAIINNIKLESLRQLMLHVDLNLLLQTNDDGYTALHIAVIHNRYKMAEMICNIIDERQLGKPVYQREEPDAGKTGDSSKSLELRDEKSFAKFYERACDRLDHNKEKLMGRRLKTEILNASEARAGNVCLYYAVEGEKEHFCYFLLAHLSDPDEENLSGHSPKSYHYEFARVLRISLKIARIMDKAIFILNGKSV